jgi:hypothetical protein
LIEFAADSIEIDGHGCFSFFRLVAWFSLGGCGSQL